MFLAAIIRMFVPATVETPGPGLLILPLAKGDSTLQDSLEVEPDLTSKDAETESRNEPVTQSIELENAETGLKDTTQAKAVVPKKKIKKV